MDMSKRGERKGTLIHRKLQRDLANQQDLRFKIAETVGEFEGAYRLVHDIYVREGYMDAQPGGMRVTPFSLEPGAITFIGCEHNKVLLTVTLFRDASQGLPMDSIYKAELDMLRSSKRKIVEVGALAVESSAQLKFHSSVMMLFKFVLLYVWRQLLVDDMVVVINPKHQSFYERVLSFRPLGPEKAYGSVRGNPAIALRLDLKWDKKRFLWVTRLADDEARLDEVV
jgi:hypothetical protein